VHTKKSYNGIATSKYQHTTKITMSTYRRANIPGGTYFFTVVTYRRQRIFSLPAARAILREAIQEVRISHPFVIDAWVLLPDHLHCIWTLPPEDKDFSMRWGRIKAGFSKRAGKMLHKEELLTVSRKAKRESTIWQRRFWEHAIHSREDFQRHVDYIHYNPVKHGLVDRVSDWPYSTFHNMVQEGIYPADWASSTDLGKDMTGE